MPIPDPYKSEAEKDFISRCMGDKVMVREYPRADQRRAVCGSAWKNRKNCEAVKAWARRLNVPPCAVSKTIEGLSNEEAERRLFGE